MPQATTVQHPREDSMGSSNSDMILYDQSGMLVRMKEDDNYNAVATLTIKI